MTVTSRLIMQKARGRALPEGHSASTACRCTVSGTFDSPNRGAFHLSLTVLVHYRSQRSIQPWMMVHPDSHRVSRVPWYSGMMSREPPDLSHTGLSPSMAVCSKRLLLGRCFVTLRPDCNPIRHHPSTPNRQRLQAWHLFGLGCSAFARRY